MLFIIYGNGFAYAQTFNETPIPAFTPVSYTHLTLPTKA